MKFEVLYYVSAREKGRPSQQRALKRIEEIRKKFLTKPSSCVSITKLLTEKRVSKFDKKLRKNSKEFEKALDKRKTAC